MRAGYPRLEAAAVAASDADLHKAAELLTQGCTVAVALGHPALTSTRREGPDEPACHPPSDACKRKLLGAQGCHKRTKQPP